MTKPDLYIGGKQLELAKRIGKGAEGEVYLLGGVEKKAIKVYTGAPNPGREAKVKAMVRHQLARSSTLVAFPAEIVTTRAGAFTGFSMRLVEGFREIHQLYGPKSRKIHYPNADFRFLVRAAANAARAIGQVHGSPSVIGDLNESGLLVSSEATVALVDADSFQFEADGKVYPCLVGKPDFTAPELHGRSLAGVTRVKAHDHFGLAVTIFQLLFMGRHPYAGVKKGSDLSLDQMIAANLFAYSKRRQTDVIPPGILPSLDNFPTDIADGFERAFGLDPATRPAAAEWVNLLQGLESHLSRCANHAMHFFPSVAKTCPWCRMEGATGAVLFLSATVDRIEAATGVADFDIEKAWAAIKTVALPDPVVITPKLPSLSVGPSKKARETKAGSLERKLFGAVLAIAAIAAWFNIPDGALLWIGALIFAFFQFGKSAVDTNGWQSRYSAVDKKWDEGVAAWRDALGITGVFGLRADLEAAVNEYRGLSAEKRQAVALLKNERHGRQLNDHLDHFLIRRASISGIGRAKTITLASFGIESAADIKRNAILAIPGFGPVTADKLMAWRAQLEKRFVYNPAPNQSDVAAESKLDADFANRASALARRISAGHAELLPMANTLHQRLGREDGRLSEIAVERAQLASDLTFLGIAKPYKPAAAKAPFYPATTPPAQTKPKAGSGASLLCPNCGAHMVRRTARRGHRRGHQFWGCSRYPSCRGTRP
jgi:DNA-binding helix-hairpin-helix protein with protein kinase domain